MNEYNKRLTEVDEVLNHLSYEHLLKIPENIRNLIEENKDPNYIWIYDETKPLKDQNLNSDTIAILSYLNMEYLLNIKQKKLMEQIHRYNEEKQLKENNFNNKNLNDLFTRNKKDNQNMSTTDILPFKENFFSKLFKKFKKIFNKHT